jgi:predicted AAA+ superfamily ATPase
MIIQRKLSAAVKKTLVSGKVNVIYGARRVGKTFFMKQLLTELNLEYIWLNGEVPETQELIGKRNLNDFENLIGDKEILIIDEAQEVPNIGKALKLLVDEFPKVKILVSGSSAFDLNNNLGEPLVGRAYWYEMYPLAQMELGTIENLIETKQKLGERLVYGSYPELYFTEGLHEKEHYMRDVANAYLLKDMIAFDGIRNSGKVMDLLKLLAFQLGKEVSLQELGKQLGMSKNTVEKYIDLLEKVYILKRIGGFSRNLRKEITKTARYYFWDNGVRNAVIGDFRPLASRNDIGQLWENYLMAERLKKNKYNQTYTETYFWRTYDQQEIDCVEVNAEKLATYEFKWSTGKAKFPKAFSEAYPESTFEVISRENYLWFVG